MNNQRLRRIEGSEMSDSAVFTCTLAPAPIHTHRSVQTESRGGVSLVAADAQPWSGSSSAAYSILAVTCRGHPLILPTVLGKNSFFPI